MLSNINKNYFIQKSSFKIKIEKYISGQISPNFHIAVVVTVRM